MATTSKTNGAGQSATRGVPEGISRCRLLAVAIGLLSAPAWAQTTLSSSTSTPYILNGGNTVIINNGVALTGSPGIQVTAGSGNQIQNSGTIGAAGDGVQIISGASVAINNTGAIQSSTGSALYIGGTLTSLVNTGTIAASASSNYAIFNVGTITSLTNTGTIASPYAAILNFGTISSVNNSGLLDGLVSLGTATLNLNGPSGRVTGAVYGLSNSTTNVNGTFATENIFNIGTFNVASGGVLTLNNQVTASNGFNNAGTLIVPVGTKSIVGNFTNTGTFSPVITNNSTYGKLSVTGNVTLGGTLLANNGGNVAGLSAGTLSGIITYTGTRSGQFATITGANNLFTWTANYDDAQKSVDLVLASAGGSSGYQDAVLAAGQTPASGAAAALDAIAAADLQNPVVLSFANVPQAQVANAVSQTLPLMAGNATLASNSAVSGINHVVQARVGANNSGMSSGDEFYGDRHVWMKPFGSIAAQGNLRGVAGFDSRVGGLVGGIDGALSDTHRVGLALAYASASVDSNSSTAPNSVRVNIARLIAYGSVSLDPSTELNYQVDIGSNQNNGSRQMPLLGAAASADYRSLGAHAGLRIARTIPLSEVTSFTPSVRADYSIVKDSAYTESGAGVLNLSVDSKKTEQLILSADGKFARRLSDTMNLVANLGLGYDTMAKKSSLVAAYAGAPGVSFTTVGLDQKPWIVQGGLGLSNRVGKNMEYAVRYDVEGREKFVNQTASVKLRWSF